MIKVGGIKTDFIIITNTIEIPVVAQALLKRGISNYKSDYGLYHDGAYGHAYGYGLETFHFEFATTTTLTEIYRNKENVGEKYYEIELLDENDKSLMITELDFDDVKIVYNGVDLTTYSINFNKIPLILLDKTRKINIQRIRTHKL